MGVEIELRHLRYFIAVAEAGSVTVAAARKLHTSQPSLSRQIRDLEDEVGAALLTRGARGIELTPAGRAFLDHARLVLSQVEAAAKAARGIAHPAKPCFVMGFLTNHELTWMPEAFRILRDELPMHRDAALVGGRERARERRAGTEHSHRAHVIHHIRQLVGRRDDQVVRGGFRIEGERGVHPHFHVELEDAVQACAQPSGARRRSSSPPLPRTTSALVGTRLLSMVIFTRSRADREGEADVVALRRTGRPPQLNRRHTAGGTP